MNNFNSGDEMWICGDPERERTSGRSRRPHLFRGKEGHFYAWEGRRSGECRSSGMISNFDTQRAKYSQTVRWKCFFSLRRFVMPQKTIPRDRFARHSTLISLLFQRGLRKERKKAASALHNDDSFSLSMFEESIIAQSCVLCCQNKSRDHRNVGFNMLSDCVSNKTAL